MEEQTLLTLENFAFKNQNGSKMGVVLLFVVVRVVFCVCVVCFLFCLGDCLFVILFFNSG